MALKFESISNYKKPLLWLKGFIPVNNDLQDFTIGLVFSWSEITNHNTLFLFC